MAQTARNQTSVGQSVVAESIFQKAPLGTTLITSDGRQFVYCEAGAAILAARLVQSSAVISNHAGTGRVTDTIALGARTVGLTLGSTEATENQYAEGYLITNDGVTSSISGHPAAASGASLTVLLDEPIAKAIGSSGKTLLIAHPNKGVTLSQSPATSGIVGVTIIDVTNAYFFWAQTKGICGVRQDGVFVPGVPLFPSYGSTKGTMSHLSGGVASTFVSTASSPEKSVGEAVSNNNNGSTGVVNLHIS